MTLRFPMFVVGISDRPSHHFIGIEKRPSYQFVGAASIFRAHGSWLEAGAAALGWTWPRSTTLEP